MKTLYRALIWRLSHLGGADGDGTGTEPEAKPSGEENRRT